MFRIALASLISVAATLLLLPAPQFAPGIVVPPPKAPAAAPEPVRGSDPGRTEAEELLAELVLDGTIDSPHPRAQEAYLRGAAGGIPTRQIRALERLDPCRPASMAVAWTLVLGSCRPDVRYEAVKLLLQSTCFVPVELVQKIRLEAENFFPSPGGNRPAPEVTPVGGI